MSFTGFLQLEQNSSMHVGHRTATGTNDIVELDLPALCEISTRHTVSQPALGHQVRLLSKSISALRVYKKLLAWIFYTSKSVYPYLPI